MYEYRDIVAVVIRLKVYSGIVFADVLNLWLLMFVLLLLLCCFIMWFINKLELECNHPNRHYERGQYDF